MHLWHTMSPAETAAALRTDLHLGLSEREARQRLERYGPNELKQKEKPSLIRQLWEQLKDPMILVLLAPLSGRESDAITSLSFALLLILLANPYAAASISLQLSFAAMAGMLTLTPRIYDAFSERCRHSLQRQVRAGCGRK